MNRNISTILFLILILTSVFASITIENNSTWIKGDVNLTFNLDSAAQIVSIKEGTTELNYTKNDLNTVYSIIITSEGTHSIDYNFATFDTVLYTGTAYSKKDTTAPDCNILLNPNNSDYNNVNSLKFNFTCSDSGIGLDKNIAKIEASGFTTTTITDGNTLSWLTANKTYTITIDSNDLLGNLSAKTLKFNYDTTAPTVTFVTNPYTNDSTPDLNFTANDSNTTGWKVIFSCDEQAHWTSERTYSSRISDFDITSAAPGCSLENGESGKIWSRTRDAAGNWSTVDSETLIYDTEDPELSEDDFTITPDDGEIIITWNDPNKDYELVNVQALVYLDGVLKKSKTEIADDEKITITGLNNGYGYDVTLNLSDKASNVTTLEYETIVPRGITTTIALTPDTYYIKSGDRITAKCTFSDDATGDALLEFKYTYPNTNKEELDGANNTTSLEGSITVTDVKHEGIYFYCSADQSNSVDAFVRIDNNKPLIEWKDTNNLFIGMRRIVFKATDNYSLVKVEIDFNNSIKAVTSKDTNNNYYLDLNTAKYENGTYLLKAIATDEAGNKTTIERTVTLDNYLSPKQLAERAINTAKDKQKTSIDLVNYYKAQALIIPSDLNTKKVDADTLLANAISELNSQFEKARTDANNASKLFDEFNANATTQVKETLNYTNDENKAIELLQKYGLSAEEASNQINTMKNTGITRKLIVIQTGSSANRQIKIELQFTNDTNSDIIRIVEVIPKELIELARNIVSDANFRIIKDDPVIEFTVPVAKGATTTISYGIGEMDSIKAQEILDKNVIALFETAPIVLDGNLTTENSLKNLNNGNEFLLLIIGLLVILIIIAVSLFFVKFKMPGHGFGEEKTLVEHIKPEEKESKKKFEAFKK